MFINEIKMAAGLLSGLLLCNVSHANDDVYLKSSEPCLVGAFTAPGGDALPEKIKCGEKARLLERKGDFVRVRINDDKTVWLKQQNISLDPPAEREVQRLMAYQKKIEAELNDLNKQVKSLSDSSQKLINALIAAEAEKNNNK